MLTSRKDNPLRALPSPSQGTSVRIMDPIASYNGKAQDYSAYRLPYSHQVTDAIVRLTSLDSSWTIADIGSGTGRLTQFFAERVGCIGNISR